MLSADCIFWTKLAYYIINNWISIVFLTPHNLFEHYLKFQAFFKGGVGGKKALEGELECYTLVRIWSLLEWNISLNGWCDFVIYSDGFEVSSCHIGLVLEWERYPNLKLVYELEYNYELDRKCVFYFVDS